MEIRRAENGDISRITELLYQVHKVHSDKRPDLFRRGAKKYTEDELRGIIADDERPVFAALLNGEIAGYAFCVFQRHGGGSLEDFTTLYIDDLCVDEKYRHEHVGSALYQYVLDFAKKSGCHNLTLNVWECNPGAMNFYKKMGLSVQKTTLEQLL
ncbi:MAG TPA: GNAT family N-acetyltransferase [Ruminococcaceae bacterium]|nr:GNAT family N-acetyltransferase [Oscillospiraceae bacterium]